MLNGGEVGGEIGTPGEEHIVAAWIRCGGGEGQSGSIHDASKDYPMKY